MHTTSARGRLVGAALAVGIVAAGTLAVTSGPAPAASDGTSDVVFTTRCEAEDPRSIPVGPNHFAACHRNDQ